LAVVFVGERVTSSAIAGSTRVVDAVAMAVAVSALVAAAVVDLLTIVHRFPLDLYEPAVVFFTRAISSAVNPYDLANLPAYGYVYTPLYNMVAAPFTGALTATASMQAHRVLSACLIAAVLWLLWAQLRTVRAPLSVSALLIALIAVQLVTSQVAIARPDALGVFLHVGALMTFWRSQSPRSLAVAVGLGILGFWTKQNFAAAVPLVCGYVLLFVSKRLAVQLATLAIGTVGAIYAASVWLAPFLFWETLRIHVYDHAPSNFYRYYELRLFLHTNFGLVLAAILVATSTLWQRVSRLPACRVDVRRWNAPLVRGLPGSPLGYSTIVSGLIYLWLAGGAGNEFVYSVCFFTPVLGVWLAAHLTPGRMLTLASVALLSINVVFCAAERLHAPRGKDEWQRVEAVIAQHRRVLHAPALATLVADTGQHVWDTGHTATLWYVAEFDRSGLGDAARRRWPQYIREINSNLERCEFDAVILTPEIASHLYTPELFDVVRTRYRSARSWRLQPRQVLYTEWIPDASRCSR
jgi:hypothetical protein